MSPKVSILLPVFNDTRFLPEAIASIRAQTLTDFECLVCDASTEGSCAFLHETIRQDGRFRLIYKKNASLPESLQMGVEAARAPVLARMDADDVSLPGRLETQLAALGNRPETALLGCAFRYIDASGAPGRVVHHPERPPLPEALLWGCPFLHPGAMLRRAAVLEAGGYRAAFPRAEDYDLWLRLSRRWRLENLPNVLVHYRLHGDNSILLQARETRRCALRAQALYLLSASSPAGAEHLPLETLLARLAPRERANSLLRALACHAPALGDESEDAEGAAWLAESLPAASPATRKKALCLWHLRCAKRYLRSVPSRAARHAIRALAVDAPRALALALRIALGLPLPR